MCVCVSVPHCVCVCVSVPPCVCVCVSVPHFVCVCQSNLMRPHVGTRIRRSPPDCLEDQGTPRQLVRALSPCVSLSLSLSLSLCRSTQASIQARHHVIYACRYILHAEDELYVCLCYLCVCRLLGLSHADHCGDDMPLPAVFTRVSSSLQWILATVSLSLSWSPHLSLFTP